MVSCWARLCNRKKQTSVTCKSAARPALFKIGATVQAQAGASPYVGLSTSASQAVVVPKVSIFEELSSIMQCNSESGLSDFSWPDPLSEALRPGVSKKPAEPQRLFKPNKLRLAAQSNEVFVSPFAQLSPRSRPKLVPITPPSLKSLSKR